MPQFRIRTLMLLTTAVAVGLAAYQLWTGPTLNERLQIAAKAGHTKRFEWLIWLGADVDAGFGRQSYGGAPMMWRAWEGDLRAVKLYVEHGAYLDHAEKDNFTAITLAADAGHWDVVEYLYRRGANHRMPDATGSTAVDYAAAAGRADILDLFHRNPTPLAQWRIVQRDFSRRAGDDGPYNRSFRVMYRVPGSAKETSVKWFRALVDHNNGSERTIHGPVDIQFLPDGNSVTVRYADGFVEQVPL